MKYKLRIAFAVLFTALLISCSSSNTTQAPEAIESPTTLQSPPTQTPASDNSQTSLDWPGVYKGTIPCADCEGIEVRISLKSDKTFKRDQKYLGKDDKLFFEEGTFQWGPNGSKITISTEEGNSQIYLVGENALFYLDKEGNRITGDLAKNYVLAKNPTDFKLEGKKWILTEIKGKSFQRKQGNKEAFLLFEMESSSFSGNGSCNNVFGGYELLGENRISIGSAGATMMACPDMKTERLFLDILEQTTQYNVSDNSLSLMDASQSVLAKFKL